MEKDEIKNIVVSALMEVYSNDKFLLEAEVGENCINHRLALYMTKKLEQGNIMVDAEYNRHFNDLKYYKEDTYGCIDIVVHERNTDKNNLCAIECKKGELIPADIEKINALISPLFGYLVGITIEYRKKLIRVYSQDDNNVQIEEIQL